MLRHIFLPGERKVSRCHLAFGKTQLAFKPCQVVGQCVTGEDEAILQHSQNEGNEV